MSQASPSSTALNRAMRRWSLTRPVLVAETPSSFVYRVARPEGPAAALKVIKDGPGNDERRCGRMLSWYDGAGAVGVYGLSDDAVLMQWLDGETLGDLVRSGHDSSATDILCDVVEQLHAPRPTPPPGDLQPLRERFESLFQARSAVWPRHVLDLVARATGIAYGLFDQWSPRQPLHGDLHHDNILRTANDWVVIDPKGLVGDPAYEFANSFQNPERAEGVVLRPSRVARHAATISERTGILRRHLLAWAVAHTALSAAWHLEDGNSVTHQVAMLPLLIAAYDAA